jgi:hypothetical protein
VDQADHHQPATDGSRPAANNAITGTFATAATTTIRMQG